MERDFFIELTFFLFKISIFLRPAETNRVVKESDLL